MPLTQQSQLSTSTCNPEAQRGRQTAKGKSDGKSDTHWQEGTLQQGEAGLRQSESDTLRVRINRQTGRQWNIATQLKMKGHA